MENKTPNELVHETSPYLLQHAYNPVHWYPWGEAALNKARDEDKPILVSIGYSACHWCHVMEKESFENVQVAALMNTHFINIKVDREERPDIDHIYMEAIQTMNIRGGWPLNVFLTSDAKPFYGGTYFPESHWTNLLQQIHAAYINNREKLEQSAHEFTNSLNQRETDKYGLLETDALFSEAVVVKAFQRMETSFDTTEGGMNKAPKFPMPSIYQFLLRYYSITKYQASLKHVQLTLSKMAMGGIYDQILGGFARYSTDALWFAPHFEKMLYDNGQLVSLYSQCFQITNDLLYKEVVYETVRWLEKEMLHESGGFYAAIDADSEGSEGKYYVWHEHELLEIFDDDFYLVNEYYNTAPEGNWESGENILYRTLSDVAFANKFRIDLHTLRQKVKEWKVKLNTIREKRIKPGLDDKILVSWNGIMLKGLVDAYRAFHDPKILQLANKNASFLKNIFTSHGKLYHNYKNQQGNVNGFLEDYAFVIQAYIALYQSTFEEEWLQLADSLAQISIDEFYDIEEGMFYFTASAAEDLIARKKEIFDNVIPASNSVMAENLYWLGKMLDNNYYLELSLGMLNKMKKLIPLELAYLSNWASLYTTQISPTFEIAIVGKDYLKYKAGLDELFLPNAVFVGTETKSNLPLLQNRESKDDETTIYVCLDKTCQLPVNTVGAAIAQILSFSK